MDERSGPAPLPADPSGLLGGDRLLDHLERWAADARVTEAARRRSQERFLREAAEGDATLAGVLTDLGERQVTVSLSTLAGRRHVGAVAAIGSDFVALRAAVGHVLLAVGAIAVVRTAPTAGAAVGDRAVQTDLDLAGVLGGLAEERERVVVVSLDGTDAVAGQLRSVGRDVLVLRTEGERRSTCYVRLAAVGEVAPDAR